jgi:hypothetical protein
MMKAQMSQAASMFQALQGRFLAVLEAYKDKLPDEAEETAPEVAEPAAEPEAEATPEAEVTDARSAEEPENGPETAKEADGEE